MKILAVSMTFIHADWRVERCDKASHRCMQLFCYSCQNRRGPVMRHTHTHVSKQLHIYIYIYIYTSNSLT